MNKSQSLAPTSNSPVILPVLKQHVAELQALWEQRDGWIRLPDLTVADVARVDVRLLSHVEAILLHGDALVPLMQPQLGQGEPSAVFVAVYLLLRVKSNASRQAVCDALRRVTDESLAGFRDALCQSPIDDVHHVLLELERSGEANVCLMASEVLAVRGRLDAKTNRWKSFLEAPDAKFRQAAWRIAAYVSL